MRRALTLSLSLGSVFVFLGSWMGLSFIPYWFEPPVGTALTDGRSAILWALHRFVSFQIAGFGIGAVLGLVIHVLLTRRSVSMAQGNPALASGAAPTAAGANAGDRSKTQ